MDLGFSLPAPDADAELPAADMALLVALIAERQAESVTARVQAAIGEGDEGVAVAPLAPADGTFNTDMAARLISWKQE